jgi:hypothetical protein
MSNAVGGMREFVIINAIQKQRGLARNGECDLWDITNATDVEEIRAVSV